jgi:very-short-patch-repair endonuclease
MAMQNHRNLPGGAVTRARTLRRNRTEAEDKLWYALRERMPAHKWRFQVPFHPYYADFACLKAKLIIEVDGGQHDDGRASDTRRTSFLESQGFKVLRFWNHDVLANTDGVLEAISLSLREREGGAQRRKGEGEPAAGHSPSPSPSHAAAQRGPSVGWTAPRAAQGMPGACLARHSLPVGEGK